MSTRLEKLWPRQNTYEILVYNHLHLHQSSSQSFTRGVLYKMKLKNKRKHFGNLTFVEQEGKRFVRRIQMPIQNSSFAKFEAGFMNPLSWRKTFVH